MIRTFIAIDIPSNIKEEIVHFQEETAGAGLPVRWIKSQNIHLTLKFIGEIPESLVNQVIKDIFEGPSLGKKFKITIGGTGVFPNIRRPRIFWVGITSGQDETGKLANCLEERLVHLNISKEKRPFSPHLTIGRFRESYRIKNLENFISSEILHAGSFAVDGVKLMKSVLKPSGAEYSELAVHSLTG
ncbi:hypothetical protein AMJ80_07330 [bacterium SM23_31]|nr:MAG: hypothetical protein AMJ80_07330 [bacterium SM23_31]